MTIITKPLMAALAIACAGAVQAEAPAASPHAGQPHAGQQQRAIKALSAGDVAGLLAGSGAGFAKAAELNGYPGPLHVLELANELRLSDAQAESTRSLMARHKRKPRGSARHWSRPSANSTDCSARARPRPRRSTAPPRASAGCRRNCAPSTSRPTSRRRPCSMQGRSIVMPRCGATAPRAPPMRRRRTAAIPPTSTEHPP
jgi:hypothetical protein